jgi:hypothetical protein
MHFNPFTSQRDALRPVLTLCLLVAIAVAAIAAATAAAATPAAADEQTSL